MAGDGSREVLALMREVRTARVTGKLKDAVALLDRAIAQLPPGDLGWGQAIAEEASELGRALEARRAPLAALSEHLRALDLSPGLPQAREGIARGIAGYAGWAPPPGSLVPGNQLLVGATGAFWVGRSVRARVCVLTGGINTETVSAARQALDVAGGDVGWLLLDMKKLAYVGSTGLAAMVKVAEGLETRGGGLVLFSVAPNLGVIIETLGLSRYLNTAPDLGKAILRVRERRGSSLGNAPALKEDEGREPSGLD